MKKICFLLLLVCCFSCKKEDPKVFDIAILNGSVIDLETGKVTKQHVFISGGVIEKVIPAEGKTSFTGKTVVEAENKYVLPGFWDNHVHFRGGDSLIEANAQFLKLFLANGITSVRDAGGDLGSTVLRWRGHVEIGDRDGPHIYTSGPKLDGPNATWAGSVSINSEDDIPKALDYLDALGVDFVKLYDSRIDGELYLKTIAEAEKRGMLTAGHMPFTVELGETLDSGMDAIEHLYYILKGCSSEETAITEAIRNGDFGFWQSMEQLIATYDRDTAQKTFQKLKDNNTFVVPTLHIGDVLSYLDEVDHSEDPYLKLMDSGIVKTYQGRIDRALNASEESRNNRKELNDFFKLLTVALNNAGVKLLAGSDSGAYNSYTYPGISLHDELKAMVAAGMDPIDAIRTSAYNGADYFGKQDEYGTVSEGKFGDVVVLNANPLEDIHNTRKVYRVIQGTKVFDPTELCPECSFED